MKIQTEMELKDAKMQLERQKDDISSLKKEVQNLVKHMERVDGSFSETETEATFNDTQKLQSLYKKELSHLNSTALELEAKVKARLDATKTELEAKLKKMQDKNEGNFFNIISKCNVCTNFYNMTFAYSTLQ